MRLLVKNIARIVGIESTGRLRCCGADMNKLGTLDDAWLLAEDGRFAAFGRMDSLGDIAADEVVDAAGGMLFPSFCDSHTHLVYAGSREREFLDKINGLSYEEIARRGGGILNSADRLHETPEDELYAQAMERVREIAAMGTGCVEIKSGYGLSTGDELKMLRVIRRIRESVPRGACRGACLPGTAGGVCRSGVQRNAARRGGRRAGRFRRRLLRRRFFHGRRDGPYSQSRAQTGAAGENPCQRTGRLGRRAGGRGLRRPVGGPPRTHGTGGDRGAARRGDHADAAAGRDAGVRELDSAAEAAELRTGKRVHGDDGVRVQVGRERADHIGGFHTRRAEHAGRERGHGAELSEMLRQLLAQVARDHDAVDRVRADGVGRDGPVAEADDDLMEKVLMEEEVSVEELKAAVAAL